MMSNKLIYVITDCDEQILGIFETFELAKENVELLCTKYELDKYCYTEELLKVKIAGNIAKIKLIVKISISKCSWKYYTITEYKLNELVEW